MISAAFEPILDSENNIIGKRLTIYFNTKVVSSLDYPPEATMTQDELDSYIVGKLSGILS